MLGVREFLSKIRVIWVGVADS